MVYGHAIQNGENQRDVLACANGKHEQATVGYTVIRNQSQ